MLLSWSAVKIRWFGHFLRSNVAIRVWCKGSSGFVFRCGRSGDLRMRVLQVLALGFLDAFLPVCCVCPFGGWDGHLLDVNCVGSPSKECVSWMCRKLPASTGISTSRSWAPPLWIYSSSQSTVSFSEDLHCAHCPVCSSSNLTFWIEYNVLKCIHTIWARASPTCCTRAYELISWPCPSRWGCPFWNGWMSTASPPVQSPFNVAIMHSGCCMICLDLFERSFEPLWFCGHCVCTALDKEVPEYEDDITADYQSKHKALVCTLCLLCTWTFVVSILLYTIWTELLILWITVLSDKYCKGILIVVVQCISIFGCLRRL